MRGSCNEQKVSETLHFILTAFYHRFANDHHVQRLKTGHITNLLGNAGEQVLVEVARAEQRLDCDFEGSLCLIA